ncbi:MAG: PilN domain-containing protein [bacterium]
MIKINLVPQEFLAKQKQQHRILQAVAAGILVISLLSMISFWHMSRATRIEAVLKQKEARLKQLQEVLNQVKALESEGAAVKAHLDAINALGKIRLIYTKFLQDFAKTIPGSVWFTALRTSARDSNTVDFNISGMSRSTEDLAGWLHTLETSGSYSGVELGGINITAGPTGKTLSFPIKAVYVVPKR